MNKNNNNKQRPKLPKVGKNKAKKDRARGQRPLVDIDQRSVPNALPASVRPAAPQIITRNGKTIIVGHEEFATLSGSVAFAATRYQCNPGLASLFAWLSGRAQGYEKYKLHALELVYVPAEAVVTTAGVVYLAFDYDPDDAAPGSLASLSTYEGLQSGHAYEVVRCRLDMARVQRDLLKVRAGPKAGSRILYDPASLIVATVSMGGSSAIGQLWIGYELELLAPQLEPSTSVPSSISEYNESTTQALATGVGEAVLWTENVYNGLEITNSSGTLTLPSGLFKVSGIITFNDTSAEVVEYTVEIQKNAATLSPAPSVTTMELTGLANGLVSVPFLGIVQMNGTDTLIVVVTATGAAGTLSLSADRSKLIIEAI